MLSLQALVILSFRGSCKAIPMRKYTPKAVAAIAVGIVLVFLGKDFLAMVMSTIQTVSGYLTPAV